MGLLSRNERLNHDFFWHCKFFIFLLDSCYAAHNAKNIRNALNFFWLFIFTFCVLWIELVVIIFEALAAFFLYELSIETTAANVYLNVSIFVRAVTKNPFLH